MQAGLRLGHRKAGICISLCSTNRLDQQSLMFVTVDGTDKRFQLLTYTECRWQFRIMSISFSLIMKALSPLHVLNSKSSKIYEV